MTENVVLEQELEQEQPAATEAPEQPSAQVAELAPVDRTNNELELEKVKRGYHPLWSLAIILVGVAAFGLLLWWASKRPPQPIEVILTQD